MNHVSTFIIASALCILPLTQTLARLDPGTGEPAKAEAKITGVKDTKPQTAETEIVVIEAANCTYCDLFRRNVLPMYQSSDEGKSVSVRFVDINDTASANLKLSEPVEMVPTVVVTKNSVETGRIPGYSGYEDFSQSVKYLLSGNH